MSAFFHLLSEAEPYAKILTAHGTLMQWFMYHYCCIKPNRQGRDFWYIYSWMWQS